MKFTREEKSWALYDWANSAYSIAVTTALFPIAFNKFASLGGLSANQSTAYLSGANSLYAIIMAVLSPILGVISDYKGVKKRFFTFFWIVGVAGTFALALIAPSDHAWRVALAIYIVSAIGLSGSIVFNDSLLVDVTSDERMHRVSGFGWGIGYLGGVIPFIISCVVIVVGFKLDADKSLPIAGLRVAFLVTGVWWAFFSIPFLKNVKQTRGMDPEKNPIGKSFIRLFTTFKNAAHYKKPFLFLLGYFFYIDGVGTIFKVASDFAIKMGVGSTKLLGVLILTQLVAFPCTLIFGRLSKSVKSTKLLAAGISVYILVTLIGVYVAKLPAGSTLAFPLFMTMALLVGTAQGGVQSLSRSYFGKIIPKHKSGEFFGLYDIFAKFAAILGPFFIFIGAKFFHGYSFGLSCLVVMFVVGLILLFMADKEPEIA